MGVALLQSGRGELGLGERVAIVRLVSILGGDGDCLRVDGKGAIGGSHQIVAHRNLGARSDGNAVDRGDDVGLRADVGDGGVPGHHDGEGVGVALLQIGRDEAVLGQRRAVVGLRCVIGGNGDLLRVDGEVTLDVDDGVVAGVLANLSLGRDDLLLVGTDIRLAARERDARERIAALEASDGHVGVEPLIIGAGRTLGASVVGVGLVLGRDGELGLVDGQVALDVSDVVVVGPAAHESPGRDDLVGVGAGVSLAAGEHDARELVGTLEASDGHVGVEPLIIGAGRTLGASVVGVGLVLGRDGELGLVDGQVALDVSDVVVVGPAAHESPGRDDLVGVGAGVSLAAGEHDARELVGTLEASDGHVGVEPFIIGASRTLGASVVDVGLVLGRDGELGLVDGQVALNVDDVVVVGRSADNGVGRNDLVGVGAGVGLAASKRDAAERVAALEALDGHIGVEAGGVVAGRTLRAAVVGVGLVLGRDGQGRLGDGEHTRDNFGDDIVAGGVLRLVDGDASEGHVVLTDVGAGAGSGDTGEGKALNRAGEARDGLLCTVVGLAFGGGGQGDGNGIDGELAGNQGTKRVELGNIFTVGISDRERLCKRTVGVYASIGALGGGVLDAQSMAICKTRDRVLSVTALLSTIVGNLLVSHGDVERRLGHLKGTEVLDDVVIACLSIVPRNRIGVIRGSRLGNGSVCCEGYRLALDKAGDGRLVLGEGGAVVCLGVRTRGDGCVLRVNLQAARTDVDAHAIVVILREVCLSQGDVVVVVARILLCKHHVAKTCGASLDSLGVNLCPNLIKILVPIALVTDHHVVGNTLGGIGKASLLDSAVVDVASPAVGLDTDGDVDLGHLERATDIVERIVVVGMRRIGLCVLGRYRRSTRVDATIVGRVVNIGIGEADACQALARGQTLNYHLTVKRLGQSQCGAVILLAVARSRNGDLLLIVDGALEAIRGNSLSDLVGIAGLVSVKARSLNCRVEFPSRNGRTAQGERLADLQVLSVGGGNCIAVHVHVMNFHGRVLIAGVVECKDVCLLACGQNQRLLDRIRIKLDVFKLRMCCT